MTCTGASWSPLDGSSVAHAALREALDLARDAQGRVRIVHVIDSPYDYPVRHVRPRVRRHGSTRRGWQETGQAVLDQALADARQVPIEPEASLIETAGRRVPVAIVDEAKSWGADLIVVGTHGRRGLDRLLLGSVAEGVSRAAPSW